MTDPATPTTTKRTWRPTRTRVGVVVLCVAGTVAAATGLSSASIPDATTGLITSCYASGTWRPIDAPTQKCRSGETQLTWNQRGPVGPVGPAGPTGATGATGPQGLQGVQGPTGPQGLQGVQGPIGPQGLQGPTGAAGANGAARSWTFSSSGGTNIGTSSSTLPAGTYFAGVPAQSTVTGDISSCPFLVVNLDTNNGRLMRYTSPGYGWEVLGNQTFDSAMRLTWSASCTTDGLHEISVPAFTARVVFDTVTPFS